MHSYCIHLQEHILKCPDSLCCGVEYTFPAKYNRQIQFDYFRLFIVATGCPSVASCVNLMHSYCIHLQEHILKCPDSLCCGVEYTFPAKYNRQIQFDYFRLFIVATGCPSVASCVNLMHSYCIHLQEHILKCPDSLCCGVEYTFPAKYNRQIQFDYFRLFIVATGCPSERRPQKTVSCYGG